MLRMDYTPILLEHPILLWFKSFLSHVPQPLDLIKCPASRV
jgi:hypothetical protein